MPVYLDIIWMLNFLFDSLLLLITGLLLKRNIKKRKILIGGFIGSLMVFFPFLPLHDVLLHPLIKIFVSICMVVVAFGFKQLRYFTTSLLIFYLCSFAAGGILIGMHYFLQFDVHFANDYFLASIKGFGDPISWVFVIIGFPIALYFSKSSFNQIEIVKIRYDQIINISIVINNQTVVLKGLIDSGNQLYDPLSKRPVMFVSLEKTSFLLPKSILALFQNKKDIWKEVDNVPPDWMDKIFVIPYRVVGQDHQLIAAIKPEKVILEINGETKESNQVLLAFTNQTLSNEGAFDCIIHPKIVHDSAQKQVS